MNAPRVFTQSTHGTEPKALFIGLYGPSGSGKTYSALRLATGIKSVFGGDIAVVDTEADRARHYMPPFEFAHYPFTAPYRSKDYLAALRQLVAGGARTIIVDSMSHEHSGPGGVTETHDKLVEEKGQKFTFSAWRIAKEGRKKLITAMTTEFKGCCFIFCFRAKDATDFEAKPPRKLGWMPISDDDFLFEMTACALLVPGCDGVPTFRSDMPGERQYLKLPGQFRSIFKSDRPLDETTGAALATWAKGGDQSPRQSAPSQDAVGNLAGAANAAPADLSDAETLADDTLAAAAKKGMVALTDAWRNLDKAEQRALKVRLDTLHKKTAEIIDAHEGAADEKL
jgi:GTPase SAR1 family protein